MSKVTDITIFHEADTSLHIQLYSALRQLIVSGHWSLGSQIPSESKFANHLNISRTTVRLALQHAEIEGLINRSPGRGTFVASKLASNSAPVKLIAFITNWSTYGAHKALLTGAEAVASKNNYRVIFCNTRNIEEEIEVVKNLSKDNVAGILLWSNADSNVSYRTVFDLNHIKRIPIVFMDRSIENNDYDCVTSDNYESTLKLMKHLIDLGHKEIVFLGHRQLSIQSVKDRYRAYREQLDSAGLEANPPWLIGDENNGDSDFLVQAAYYNEKSHYINELEKLITDNPNITAILAVNHVFALFALRVAENMGMKLPERLSIVCFDDLDNNLITIKPLTAVVQDMLTIGERSAQILIQRIEGYSGPSAYDVVPSSLVIRESSSMPVHIISS